MPRLVWTPEAIGDLARLRAFIAAHNPDAARRAITTIREGLKLLRDHPNAGRARREAAGDFREWPIGFGSSAYLTLYRLDGDKVVVLAIRHGREIGWM
jgi:plasmid stabilization system protein ParE